MAIVKRILIFALLASTANATSYFVKVGGSNGAAGTSWATAWEHPNKTNGSVTYGDIIYIAPGTYDTVDIRPVAGITFRSATVPDDADSGRSAVILRGTTTLGGTWTNRGSNIWRHDQTVPPRWNAWTMSGELGHMILVRDGVMQHPVARHLNLASCDEALEFWYDVANDSLFIYSTTNPSGATFRYGQAPIVRYAENANEHNVKFIGLTLSESFQGHFMMATGDWSGSSYLADSLFVSHCNLWKSSLSMSGGNLGIFFAGFQAVTMTNVDQWGRFSGAYACSLDTCWAPPDDYSGGGGCDFYSQREFTFDSCYFGPSLRAGGIMFKMGGNAAPFHSFGNRISNNVFDGGRAAMWFGMMQDSLLIYGNIIKNQTYRGIDIHSTPSNVPLYGRLKIFNNTFWNSGAGDGEAITLTPIITDSTGSNEIKYNVIFDTSTAINAIAVRDQGEATDIDFVTHIVIDSNMYYRGGSSFATTFPAWCACTGTNFTAWQSCGFDVHGTATTNPNFYTSQTPTAVGLSRPGASSQMSRTYGGRTWTIYGAVQPSTTIADTCIRITGKITLAHSDTCYCIVDSLRYTFAQWDTLINTGGHDNIRIWGYNSGGGRGIIGYSASDTGSNATVTDLQKGSVVLHVAGSDNVLIKNLAIVPRAIDDSVRGIVGINVLTVDGINCDNDSVVAGGFSSRAYQQSTTGGNRSFDQLLQNSYFGTVSKGYHRRDALYGATVKFVTSVLKSDRYSANYTYAYKVRNCRIHTIHTGIGSAGFTVDTTPNPDDTLYPLIYIDSNTITIDTRNDLFMTYDDNDVNNSAGDPYGIGVDGVDRNSRIMGNSISSMASTHYGGDGMLLQHIDATVDSPFVVAYNTVSLQHGAHPRIAEGRQAVVGTYIRNYDANYFVKGLWYHHNGGYLVVDEDTATTYAGRYGECVRMGFENGANGNVIENNHFTLIPRDSLTRTGAGNLEVSGLTFEQHDSTYSAGDAGTGNNVAQYNYWRVPRNPIWLGGTRIGITANNVLIIGDTCNTIYDGDSTFVRFHQSGTYYSHSINNNLQDMVLQGYANTSDVIKGTVTASADSLGKQISYLRSVTVNLKDVASANVNGGTIWAVDAYGHRFDMPNSNSSGNSSDTLRWRFFGYDALPADGYVVADSNSYNNFTFWGKSGSDSASTSATINWTTSQLINVQLTSSAPSSYQIIKGTIFKQGPVIK